MWLLPKSNNRSGKQREVPKLTMSEQQVVCSNCWCSKPRNEFHKCSAAANGLARYCKECHNMRKRLARQPKPLRKRNVPLHAIALSLNDTPHGYRLRAAQDKLIIGLAGSGSNYEIEEVDAAEILHSIGEVWKNYVRTL